MTKAVSTSAKGVYQMAFNGGRISLPDSSNIYVVENGKYSRPLGVVKDLKLKPFYFPILEDTSYKSRFALPISFVKSCEK